MKNKPVELYILIILVSFEAVAALFGGISLIIDPSGEVLLLPVTLLEGSLFGSYLIPGLILFLVLGLFPLFLIFPLIFKPNWKIFNKFNVYKSSYWAWTYTLYTSITLIIWINVQVLLLETSSAIQGAFGLLGTIMLVLTLLPRVKRYYRMKHYNGSSHQASKK